MNALPEPNRTALAERPALRIVYVTETWPPEVNGVATTAVRFVEGLARRGHRILLVRPRPSGGTAGPAAQATPALLPGIEERLTRGSPLPFYPELRMGWTRSHALQSEWRQWQPDLVHIATEGPLAWSALAAARRLNLPVTSDFRTNFHAYSRHYRVGWLQGPVLAYLRAFHRRTACTMVPTEALRRELATQGFEGLSVVARGVDTRLFDPARRSEALRASWGVHPEDPVLLCVGRLAPEKNLMTLVNAHRALEGSHPRARLVLVGDGPQRAALQAACPKALFAGPQRGDDLAAHYASADLFAFPSLTETYGNVTPEAMASGLALVAFDHAAASQLVRHGDNGLLAAPGDSEAFRQAIDGLLGDPQRRRALGQAARQSMQSQGWDVVVARFEALLMRQVSRAAGLSPTAEPTGAVQAGL